MVFLSHRNSSFIELLFGSQDDDDDDEGGGVMTPVYQGA